jgi:hypothetical protein
MIGYHVCTQKKIERYNNTGAILPPVRFWPTLETAKRWAKRTGREKILEIDSTVSYPLPDHKPARWTDQHIRNWRVVGE